MYFVYCPLALYRYTGHLDEFHSNLCPSLPPIVGACARPGAPHRFLLRMAEVGVEAQAGSGPAELPFDEALLVRVKGRPKKPVRPDEAERNLPVAKLSAEIAKCNDRIQAIKEIIDLKRVAGRSAGQGGGDARSRMQGFKNEFQAVLVSCCALDALRQGGPTPTPHRDVILIFYASLQAPKLPADLCFVL